MDTKRKQESENKAHDVVTKVINHKINNNFMKLYATTTSERASKGQGGNQFLKIEIIDEERRPILSVLIDGSDYQRMDIKNHISGESFIDFIKDKIKRQ